jgi:hypothetical protein
MNNDRSDFHLVGQLAVADLRKAAKLSPDDETVNKALRYCIVPVGPVVPA